MKARWPVGSQCQRCGHSVPLLRTRRLYTCRKLMCGDRSGFGAEVVVIGGVHGVGRAGRRQ
ncbi:hypothetical protein [Bradyrhizobium sp. CIR48]|uniref:hypothetical protein n=1 Tax=Bradyrhizobium sp. CIR48 TaxID=2663840 RepID=UPI0039088892